MLVSATCVQSLPALLKLHVSPRLNEVLLPGLVESLLPVTGELLWMHSLPNSYSCHSPARAIFTAWR
jgi:hypothetical protein